jgi:hypothetical protein
LLAPTLEHLARQRIHQRLELHAALAQPGRERGSRDHVAGALEDGLLPVQRQMVEVLGHQHLGQQPRRRQPLVDDVRGYRRLDNLLAAAAHPGAAHVALNAEDAPGT